MCQVDFRVTPNPNFMLDVNLDEEFDTLRFIYLTSDQVCTCHEMVMLQLSSPDTDTTTNAITTRETTHVLPRGHVTREEVAM